MGKLTDLLKERTISKVEQIDENTIQPVDIQVANAVISQPMDVNPKSEDNNGQNDELFDLTEKEIETVRNSVVEIDTNGKDRRSIIIGMFGGIKNPRTGKRFVIPGVDFSTEDYVYEYSKYMRMLVNKPEDFKKVMNWE